MWNQVSKQILMQLWFSEALHNGLVKLCTSVWIILIVCHICIELRITDMFGTLKLMEKSSVRSNHKSQRTSYSSAPLQLLIQKVVWESLHSSWITETKLLTWRNKTWGEYIQSVQSTFKTILNHAGLTNNSNPKLKIISEELKNNHELPKPLPFNPISTVLYKGIQMHAII